LKSNPKGFEQKHQTLFVVRFISACLLASRIVVLSLQKLRNSHLFQIVKDQVFLLFQVFQDYLHLSLLGSVIISLSIFREVSQKLDKILVKVFPGGPDFGLFLKEFDSFIEDFLFSGVFEFNMVLEFSLAQLSGTPVKRSVPVLKVAIVAGMKL
jgi:hypothetical protein